MLHVSSSELGAFADVPAPPNWTDILKAEGVNEKGRRGDAAFISCKVSAGFCELNVPLSMIRDDY